MPVLTQEDLQKCRRAFKKLDHDNDGSIAVYELRHSLQDVCSPEQLNQIIDFVDTDKSGRIDFPEFLRIAQTAIPNPNGQIDGVVTPALKDLLPDEFTVRGAGTNANLQNAEDEGHGYAHAPSEKRKRPKCCFCIPMIYPESKFANCWQLLTAIAIMYAALVTPVLLAFQDQFVGEGKKQILLIDSVVNFIFIVDIFINFFSMYVDEKGELVTDPKTIACKYICTWFVPDLVSCIPLDFLLGSGGDEKGLLYAKLARMGKVARVLRLLKVLKILKLVRLLKFWTKFDNLFQKAVTQDKYEGSPSKGYQFGKFCTAALLVAHVAGCLWYALARFHEDVENTWIYSRGIEEAEIIDQYLASMYFIITTLTTVGYGDISASTNAEIVVAILLMMGGVLGYSISVGTVSSVLMQEDQRQTIISNKMQTLAHFAKDTGMDILEYQKIRRYIRRKYTESLDWMEHLAGPAQLQSLLNDLPVVLRAKMLRHMHHGRHLNLEFFSRYGDDDFFAYIVPLLSSAQFEAQEVIYIRGDYAERMYFLTKGTVVFFSFEEASHSQRQLMDRQEYQAIEQSMMKSEPFQVIVDGSTFGDFELLLGIPRQLYVRSDLQSECLALHKKDLLRTLAEFPTVAQSMRQDAMQDYHVTMKRKKAHATAKGRVTILGDNYDFYRSEQQQSNTEEDGIPAAPIKKDDPVSPRSAGEIRTPIPGEKPERKKVASERPGSPSSVVSRGPAAQRLPVANSFRAGEGGLGHRFQHVEDRLDYIEQKQEEIIHSAEEATEQQETMMKAVEEMRSTLFSLDLRIQSLVLRN